MVKKNIEEKYQKKNQREHILLRPDSYIGDVVAQATLDSTVTESTHWGDVATVTFTGAEDTPIPVNFNGVFNHLRFKTTASPTDKISKILVRN